MEKRTLIAFILALFVILWYPSYLKKYYPPKTPPEVTKEIPFEKEPLPVRELQPAAIITTPEAAEEEITITTPLLEVTFSNYEGTIKNIKLFEYLDKMGNPVELVTPLPSNYRPMATNLPQNASAYTLTREGSNLICTATAENLKITKIYSINPDSYIITIDLVLENIGIKEIILPNYNINVGTIFPGEETQAKMYIGATNLIDGRPVKNKLGKSGFRKSLSGRIFWSGIKNKYFTLILKPQTLGTMVTVSDYQNEAKRGVTCQITMPQLIIPAAERIEESFILYAGPKKYEILKSLGSDLDEIMDFGMLAPLSKLTLNILNFFYKLIHNYGIAIILLTLLVKLILYPLTLKSYKSMRAMHKLQPYIQELQKKYKSDPKRMQKEMMLLYKEHKVNPVSGCFPMMLQMPALIALFTTLRSAIELRGAPFILWIKDLSEPDSFLRLPNGFPINILPIFLMATMFIQQKMTAMPATNEQQKQQQKMMGTIMPLFLGFIFYNMPSGLVLYFGLSTLLGILDQYRIEKAKNKTPQ